MLSILDDLEKAKQKARNAHFLNLTCGHYVSGKIRNRHKDRGYNKTIVSDRNHVCPCGSGKKSKNCCGK